MLACAPPNHVYGCARDNNIYVIVCSLQFETQDELNAWKSAFEVGISYALGDSEACADQILR